MESARTAQCMLKLVTEAQASWALQADNLEMLQRAAIYAEPASCIDDCCAARVTCRGARSVWRALLKWLIGCLSLRLAA